MKKFICGLLLAFSLTTSMGSLTLASAETVTTDKLEKSEDVCADNTTGYCIELQEALGQTKVIEATTGLNLIYKYIGTLYRYVASVVGIVCVAIIVISGIQISLGGISNESVSSGKARIMNALISLVLVFATGLILRTINPGFFVTGETPEQVTETAKTETQKIAETKTTTGAITGSGTGPGGGSGFSGASGAGTKATVDLASCISAGKSDSAYQNLLSSASSCRDLDTLQTDCFNIVGSCRAKAKSIQDMSTLTSQYCPKEIQKKKDQGCPS